MMCQAVYRGPISGGYLHDLVGSPTEVGGYLCGIFTFRPLSPGFAELGGVAYAINLVWVTCGSVL